VAWANPTNFGFRFARDVNGIPVSNAPIVVIHETVSSADSAINFFQTPHPNDADQASYHALIRLNGSIVYTVPFEYRAFGAGNSVFMGDRGPEAVQTNPNFPSSVNNFAYHFSLETPSDGRNNGNGHSGYTVGQYRSLAWLVSYTKVPEARITFHKTVDRSGSRKDPRSFNDNFFFASLRQYLQAAHSSPTVVPIIAKVANTERYEMSIDSSR
jgi:N-acetyl-anhydromuramyl-L-alanine amidase AmpD